MIIGQIFRYASPYSAEKESIDDLPNYFYYTNSPCEKLPLLEAGINPIALVNSSDGLRIPAILLRSSPHKIGSKETPWQDIFDPDRGHIRYFGDNKVLEPARDPADAPGNRVLLEQFALHTSTEKEARLKAAPIICFRAVRYGNRTKGNVQFEGFGLIERAERITQYDRKHQSPFTNYVFDINVFTLTDENEEFDWSWISSRRDKNLDLSSCLKHAPKSWQNWVNKGPSVLENCRRRVVKLLTRSTSEQQPKPGTKEEKALKTIMDFYSNKKN